MTRHAADPGFTLADRLAHPAPMTPLEVALVGAQVATELDGWHRGGVCHRALGPEQVEITAQPGGRLLARVRPAGPAGPATEPDTAGGTRYRAPEQLNGRPVGPAADVYSLGVLLLDALLGPRDDSTAVPDDLGSAWRYLLTGMVAASPADRPTAETVAHTLGHVPGVAAPTVAATPPAAEPPGVAPRSKLLPGGAHVEPTPIELPKPSRLGRLPIPGRKRPQEPDVRQHPDGE